MRDWSGGRGNEYFTDDPTKYYDGYGWSLTPGIWHQAPQWSFAEMSTLSGDILMPGATRFPVGRSVSWKSFETTWHVARSFVQSSGAYSINRLQTWIRRMGVPPAPLHITASTVDASTSISSASTNLVTLNSTDVSALESFVWNATLSTVVAQDGTTTKSIWVHVFTTAAGGTPNHWEIGYNSSAATGSTSLMQTASTADFVFGASTVNFYFRAAPAKTGGRGRRWKMFTMERALYAYSVEADGSSSLLYMNGARGNHTTDVTGTTDAFHTTSVSSDATWLIGGTLAIIKGPGSGQESVISTVAASSGSSGGAKIGVSFDIAPGIGSEMVIYDVNHWESVAHTSAIGSTGVIKDVAVGGNVAYFALGAATTAIGAFYWNSSVHANLIHNSAQGGADVIHSFYDPSTGSRIYKGISSIATIQYGPTPATKGSSIVFSNTTIGVGPTDYPFTNLEDYGGFLYAAKEDGLWAVRNDRAEAIGIGLGAFASSNNGRSIFTQNLLLYFTWSHSLERLYQGTVDDVGPWRGAGLKPGHQGPISGSVPVIAWSFHGIDAGTTGQSAVMAWDGQNGWHEIHRAYSTGYRIQDVYFQNNPEARSRLWVSEGDELISMPFPVNTLNPRSDKGMHYQHEAVLETATIDMGATQLKKLFNSISVHTQNLESSHATIYMEYQLDDDIGSTSWVPTDKFTRSPVDEIFIRRGNKHSIRLRFRALTQNSSVHAELHAAVLKAVGRTPVKRLWNVEAKTGDFQVDSQGLKDADPDKFYAWLKETAENNQPILMRSVWSAMDNIYVFSEFPTLNRLFTTPEGEWGGALRISIREV